MAVKIYDREKSLTRCQQILTEKSALLKIRSPYVVRLIDTLKDESSLYFVMEAALGGSLHKHLASNVRFSFNVVIKFMAEIVSAICHISSLGIIHRDLKLNNVLLSPSGHVKICDFGCAAILYVDKCDVSGVIAGTSSITSTKRYTITGTKGCVCF